ncbi:hypothetical protein JW710_05150 [Candidatus Dojkabacteria bacterium]|nr:hypothetical protein [Candidatus Dojkabacteria bacterium]
MKIKRLWPAIALIVILLVAGSSVSLPSEETQEEVISQETQEVRPFFVLVFPTGWEGYTVHLSACNDERGYCSTGKYWTEVAVWELISDSRSMGKSRVTIFLDNSQEATQWRKSVTKWRFSVYDTEGIGVSNLYNDELDSSNLRFIY